MSASSEGQDQILRAFYDAWLHDPKWIERFTTAVADQPEVTRTLRAVRRKPDDGAARMRFQRALTSAIAASSDLLPRLSALGPVGDDSRAEITGQQLQTPRAEWFSEATSPGLMNAVRSMDGGRTADDHRRGGSSAPGPSLDITGKKSSRKRAQPKATGAANATVSRSGENTADGNSDGSPPRERRVEAVLSAELSESAVVGTPVSFAVEIADSASPGSLPDARFATDFARGMHRLPLRLELASNDFDIDRARRAIVLRPGGTSEHPARFTITPRASGIGSIVVSLFRESTWLASAKFTTMVSERAKDASSIPVLERVAGAGQVQSASRVVGGPSITVLFLLDGGRFQCTLTGAGIPRTAYLPITTADLAHAVSGVRGALESLARDAKYQSGIAIEKTDTLHALGLLRSAGSALLRKLFFTNEAANPLSAALGRQFVDALIAAPSGSRVVIGIQGYSLPWHALYLQETLDGAPSADLFLGLRHVVSEVMTNVTPRYDGELLQYRHKLSVALHFDSRIDAQQGIPIVRHQLDFWDLARKQTGAISLHPRHTIAAAKQSLGLRSAHHILYFVCHAGVTTDAVGQPVPGTSWLGLPAGDGQSSELTERMLSESAQTTSVLRTGPLVFINACESAQLSPEFYDNFATYFLGRGARALIGTECKIATYFADEFAQELFRAVLSGWPVGDAILNVRKAMLAKGNALGLAYGLHGSAEARVAPEILGV